MALERGTAGGLIDVPLMPGENRLTIRTDGKLLSDLSMINFCTLRMTKGK
jgi:hypothetical protein